MTVEIAIFKIAPGTDADEFQAVAREATGHLQKFDGFQSRELLHDPESDFWIDILHWESRGLAFQAADKVMQMSEFKPFVEKIDPESVQMHHGKPAGVTA